MVIFSLKSKMATWQLCKSFFGFWSDGDTYRATGCTNIGNIFWTAAIQTMVIFKLSCYI
jgi:hypothetical protein